MAKYDSQRAKNAKLSDLDKETLEKSNYLLTKAQMQLEEQEDDIKHLNELMLYAKCVSIRDKQVEQKVFGRAADGARYDRMAPLMVQKLIQRQRKEEDLRLDAMMEYERVNELKKLEEREKLRVEELRKGAAKIRLQIDERRELALLEQERRDQETKAILKQIADTIEQEKREKAVKVQAQRTLMQGVAQANNESMVLKKREKLLEEEEDRKVLQYLLDKEKREEANDKLLAEKKIEREKELARLRAAQEKMADKQAEQDQLRAQRAFESYEREWRRKEKEAAEKQLQLEKDLREERFRQQQAREEAVASESQKLKEQFFLSLAKQKETEAQIKAEAVLRAEKNRQYALEVQAQIREKEAARRKARDDFFMEGVRLAQERQEKKTKIDAIKERKIQELRQMGVPSKYCNEIDRQIHSHKPLEIQFIPHPFVDKFKPKKGGIPGQRKDPVAAKPSDEAKPVVEQSQDEPMVAPRKLLFTFASPRGLPMTEFVAASASAAKDLGVNAQTLASDDNLQYLGGSAAHENSKPFSLNYSGYQNGVYCALGEGRTATIGRSKSRLDVQIRGAGCSVYGNGDGSCTLSAAVHEFLVTEALAALGIPTYRSLALVASPYPCYRNEAVHSCGILTRFSPCWIRFGTLEHFHLRGDHSTLRGILDAVIEEHYPELPKLESKEFLVSRNLLSPELFQKDQQNMEGGIIATEEEIEQKYKTSAPGMDVKVPLNRYALLFKRIVDRTATLVAAWQANGFVHGNLNTENFSVIGSTIGCDAAGFMDSYDPQWTPNAADTSRRYSFESQPAMAEWALSRLSLTIAPFVGESFGSSHYNPKQKQFADHADSPKKQQSSIPSTRKIPLAFLFNAQNSENILRELTDEFQPLFCRKLGEMLCQKIGLKSFQENDFETLINPMLDLLSQTGADYTTFFRLLSRFSCDTSNFAAQTTYDSMQAHSKENLLASQPTDVLSFLLRSLYLMAEQDVLFVNAEREKLSHSRGSIQLSQEQISRLSVSKDSPRLSTTQPPAGAAKVQVPAENLELLPLANPFDVSILWKQWAAMYKARLMGDMNPEVFKKPHLVAEEDEARCKLMQTLNPLHCLRQSVVKEAVDQVASLFPPNLDLTQKKL
ncbi:hypothetical protein HDU91_004070 [Kappamyces sp. JEL0680]|nr:hypothetical protein HDU91_004070 [Kappamyces sp. JEL0680]